jgi:hypothetical protein
MKLFCRHSMTCPVGFASLDYDEDDTGLVPPVYYGPPCMGSRQLTSYRANYSRQTSLLAPTYIPCQPRRNYHMVTNAHHVDVGVGAYGHACATLSGTVAATSEEVYAETHANVSSTTG